MHADAGVVVWGVDDGRWWSVCQVRPCQWKASHESSEVAVNAVKRHLIRSHLSDATDTRTEPRSGVHGPGVRDEPENGRGQPR